MSKPFSELRKKMSPGEQKAAAKKTKRMLKKIQSQEVHLMSKIPEISAGKGKSIGEFDLADCFFDGGENLQAIAYDGIIQNAAGRIGFPSDEYYQGQLIVSFYQYRHAIELKMKKLSSILGITKYYSHKLQDLWDDICKNPRIEKNETVITKALLVLAEYDVLQNEELFRYEQNNKSSRLLCDYPAIPAESFGLLGEAYQALNDAILQLIDVELNETIGMQ